MYSQKDATQCWHLGLENLPLCTIYFKKPSLPLNKTFCACWNFPEAHSILWLFKFKFLVINLPDLLKIITLVLLILIFMHQSLQYLCKIFNLSWRPCSESDIRIKSWVYDKHNMIWLFSYHITYQPSTNIIPRAKALGMINWCLGLIRDTGAWIAFIEVTRPIYSYVGCDTERAI